MSAVWFTADLHFGHKRIVELSHRPFASIEEHDQALIDNWNGVVHPEDIVWVLGDFAIEGSYKLALSYLQQLNGHPRLVTGNHDQCWVGKSNATRYIQQYIDAGFELVTPWARAKIGPHKVVLSHFPYLGDHTVEDRFNQYRLPISDTPIVHGHTHSKVKFTRDIRLTEPPQASMFWIQQIHVGVDAWDYKPVADYELVKLIEGR